jgi:hypothetical protein
MPATPESGPGSDQAEEPVSPALSPSPSDVSRVNPTLAPVLLLAEGLDDSVHLPELRQRLGEALSRDIVSLMDARARHAHASIWIGLSEDKLVLRVTPPQRPEVWRQLARNDLGADPVATIVKAVLEMLWADAFARLDTGEVQDPFCPPGMICLDPHRPPSWPPRPEVEVLDPWDTSYRRFYTWDPYWRGEPYSNPWAQPYVDRERRRTAMGDQIPAWPRQVAAPTQRRPQRLALGLLAGGGVNKGGAFLRYEVNMLRRFPQFDFGLTYVAARGQPEPFQKARRSAMVLLQRRFVSPEFELDLGASFGLFVATLEERDAEVRPYLRGLLTFALPLGHSFDLLVQSELGTTFASVAGTGLVEYALTVGLRHKF